MRRVIPVFLALALCTGGVLASQSAEPVPIFHRPLDQILDVNVRDGLVYYRALKSDRGRLDRYVASLNVAPAWLTTVNSPSWTWTTAASNVPPPKS